MSKVTKYLLNVKNLTVGLSHSTAIIPIIENISFALYKGKTFGIVGESGSGKTVTALSILRLLAPSMRITGGQILYQREYGHQTDLTTLSENQLRFIRGNSISMIFQEPMTSLNPVMKCGEQVMETIRLHCSMSRAKARIRTLELFKEVHLPSSKTIMDKYPHQLSGGQRQRVMIAMAISTHPDILIADEPTTALDVTVQHAIINLLRDLQKHYQMSILFISHDLGIIKMIADEVGVMYNGSMIEKNTVAQILSNPENTYTKGLIACRPTLKTICHRLPTLDDVMAVEITGETENKNQFAPVTNKAENDKSPVLEIKNVYVRYALKRNLSGSSTKHFDAVQDLSFSVYQNETLGIIGESGSGKSTLGKTIINLIENASGKIIYRGKYVHDLNKRELKRFRKNVQIIFQDPYSSLNPRIRIGPSLVEVMKVHHLYHNNRERIKKAAELIDKVHLPSSSFNRYPHEFSGGQRQRIGIARALASQPDFIICDESVSGLDVSIQAQILNLLNDLKDELNLTYIFISHDLAVVKYMSDRILVMKGGKLVELGSSEQICRNPQSDYTLELIRSIPE